VQKIIRARNLPEVTGYCRSQIYNLMRLGRFPRPIRLGARAVGWLESDIVEWQRQRSALTAEAA